MRYVDRIFLLTLVMIFMSSCSLNSESTGDSSSGGSDGNPSVTLMTQDAYNRYLEVVFDEPVYGDVGASSPLAASDFVLSFSANGGHSSSATISSVTKTNGAALVGGETHIRISLDIVDVSSGVETLTLGAADSSIYNSSGNVVPSTVTLGPITLNATDFSSLSLVPVWSAYNDCVGTTTGNVTSFGLLGSAFSSGELVKYGDGTGTGVNASFTKSNISSVNYTGQPNNGTDAGDLFNGILNLNETASYSVTGDLHYEVTLNGLDPAKKYSLFTFANRNGSSYGGTGSASRWTRFIISGAESYANVSSLGTLEESEDAIKLNTGYNTTTGGVVGWTAIESSSGSVTVRSENVGVSGPGEASKSYGMHGFVLMEL